MDSSMTLVLIIALIPSYIIFFHIFPFARSRLVRRRAFRYIPGPEPSSFISGSLSQVFHPDTGLDLQAKYTDEVGGAWKIYGPYGDPQIYLSDPVGLETVLLKQADKFEEPLAFLRQHLICFGDGVGSATGKKHKKHRRRLGPSLAVSNLRKMVPGFYEIAHELLQVLIDMTRNEKQQCEVNVDKLISRAALEFMIRTGMGYSFGKLEAKMFEEGNSLPYLAAAGDLVPQLTKIPQILFDTLHPFTVIGPPAFRRFLASLVPLSAVKEIKGILDVINSTVEEVLESGRAMLVAQTAGKDKEDSQNSNIIADLLDEKKQSSASDCLSQDELMGQINSLIFASLDTTTNSLGRALHVLSNNQVIQERLREELMRKQKRMMRSDDHVQPEKANSLGVLDYDEINSLPYLDAFCREIFRLYPPVASLPRMANEDITIPLQYPVTPAKDALRKDTTIRKINELTVPRGTKIYVGISGSNQDPRTWGEDSRIFNPERWLATKTSENVNGSDMTDKYDLKGTLRVSSELKKPDGGIKPDIRIPGVWANLMTFFGGPRACMGMRFALLIMKIVLSVLLTSLDFTPSSSTPLVTWQTMGMTMPHVQTDPNGIYRLPILVTNIKKNPDNQDILHKIRIQQPL